MLICFVVSLQMSDGRLMHVLLLDDQKLEIVVQVRMSILFVGSLFKMMSGGSVYTYLVSIPQDANSLAN